MVTVSQDQAFNRWDTTPDNLREAMLSEVNSDFLWKTCEDEHIPAEKIYDVAKIFGHVLLGFIHPEDMSSEIKELGIAPQIADSIFAAVSKRIFEPLKNDLLSSYAPPSKFDEIAPRILEEVKRPAAINIGEAFVSPLPTLKTASEKVPVEAERGEEPLGEFERKELERKIPPTKFTEAAGFGQEEKPEAARKDIYGGLPAAVWPVPPLKNAKSEEPPPTIIHREDSGAKPLGASSEFKIGVPLPKISEVPRAPAPLRPATIEIGKAAAEPRQKIAEKPEQTKEKLDLTPPWAKKPAPEGAAGSMLPLRPPATPKITQPPLPLSPRISPDKNIRTGTMSDLGSPAKAVAPPKPPTPPQIPAYPPKFPQRENSGWQNKPLERDAEKYPAPAIETAENKLPHPPLAAAANASTGTRVVHYTSLKTELAGRPAPPQTAGKEIPKATPLVGYKDNNSEPKKIPTPPTAPKPLT